MEALKSFDAEVSDDLFSLYAALIYDASGIRLNILKKGLLVARLAKRVAKAGFRSFHEYYRKVKQDGDELVQMLNCISTNTTRFFREPYHFHYLGSVMLPELTSSHADRRLRFWSAGCSTGEEPYSVAITICEAFRQANLDLGDWDVRILATDISTRVLRNAECGIYEADQLPEDLSDEITERYFLRGTGTYSGSIRVKDGLRSLVRFRRLNLKDSRYPFQREFDAIFCRNVMIYFDDAMKEHVVSKLTQHLGPGGALFTGHSETIFEKEGLKPVHITVYRKTPPV